MKKVLKIISGILLLSILGTLYWYYDSIIIMTKNKNINGKVEKIPTIVAKNLPPITNTQQDWTNWLRADLSNTAKVASFPTDWKNGLKKLWEVSYLCQDETTAVWSAPVIKGNRLIVVGRDDDNDILFCLNPENGKLIWKNSYSTKSRSSYGSGSRATPWITEDKVYTFSRSGDLVCWNLLDGKLLWKKSVKDEGGEEPKWGYACSPLVYNSLVIVNAGGSARTIAFDKISGEVKWKTGEAKPGYAAISMTKVDDNPIVLDFHGDGLAAMNPDTGKEYWNTPWKTSYDVNATTPVFKDNLVFITSGYKTGGQLLKVSKDKIEIVWKNKSISSHHSDPFIIGDYIYGYTGFSMQNKGEFKCLNLKTGEEKWSTNELGWGTCIMVNEHLMCMDIKGNLFLVNPNPDKLEVITQLPMVLGEVRGAAWTKPIVAQRKLFLRFKQKLLCFSLEN